MATGTTGNDNLTGTTGADTLDGLAGNDTLDGAAGDDVVIGGAGSDSMFGAAGNDSLSGGADNDYLNDNASGNDTLEGGLGNDTLYSYYGNDTVRFGLGDGQDRVTLYYAAAGEGAVLELGAGLLPGDVTLHHTNGTGDLILRFNANDQVRVETWFSGSGRQFSEIRFDDATVWTWAGNLAAMAIETLGTVGNDYMDVTAGNDRVLAGAGNDSVYGEDGNDSLYGETGNDSLIGYAGHDLVSGGDGLDYLSDNSNGNDTFSGGAGNDTLLSNYGNDTVLFDAGGGYDRVTLYYTAVGEGAVLDLGAGLLPGDVTLHHTNGSSDLILRFNASDQVGIETWFSGSGRQFSEIRFDDGTAWTWAGNLAAMSVHTQGSAANDYMDVTSTHDVVNAGDGNDTVYGEAGDDTIYGEGGNDTAYGNTGHDALLGGDGADYLYDNGGGNDTLGGGAGDDTLLSHYGNDTVLFDAGGGYDRVTLYYTAVGEGAVLELGAGLLPGDVTLHHTNGSSDLILRFNASDQVGIQTWFDGSNRQFSEVRFDDGTVWTWAGNLAAMSAHTQGSAANDYMDVTSTHDVVNAGDGNDTVYGNDGNDTIHGEGGNDTAYGNTGHDALLGGDGADYLYDNGGGDDTLDGGAGNDTLLSHYGKDTVRFDAGGGYDRVTLYYTAAGDGAVLELGAGLLPGDVTLHHTNGSSDLILRFNASDQVGIQTWFDGSNRQFSDVRFDDGTVWTWAGNLAAMSAHTQGTAANDYMDVTSTHDVVNAGAGNDTVYGNAGDDTIYGETGNDTLYAHAGSDLVIGGDGADYLYDNGGGNDTLAGGAGNDTLLSQYGNDVLRFDLGDGADRATLYYSAAGEGAVLEFGAGILPGDITLQRTDGTANLIFRVNGNDQLAIDTWFNGVNNQLSLVRFADATEWTWAAQISTMAMQTSGTAAGESIYLTDWRDIVDALGGNDYVLGYEGDDTVAGNAGLDTLIGDNGNDSLDGGDDADSLRGGAGNDTLAGGTGIDTLDGGAGNDTYVIDSVADSILEAVDAGIDTVQSTVAFTLADVLEHLALLGAAAVAGTGNALANSVAGNDGNNLLSGLGGIDTLSGGAGNDTLDGGAGADSLRGGAGDDVYLVNLAGDVVTELAGEGIDRVESAIAYTLGVELEQLVLTGSGNNAGTGNDAANTLQGNGGHNLLKGLAGGDAITGGAGNDTLNGGDGADTLVGGAGDDRYVVASAGDLVQEDADAGNDQVQSSIDWTLAANLEQLVLSGSALAGVGNGLANLVTGTGAGNLLDGRGGDDTLDGGAGVDTLVGGLGNDSYVVDNSLDTVTEAVDAGLDLVTASASHTLGTNVESLVLTGAANLSGTGNSAANSLQGNTGANLLSGALGNDTLVGGAGADTLDGGWGNDSLTGGGGDDVYVVNAVTDVLVEFSTGGIDTVRSQVSYVLGNYFEHLVLTGEWDSNATGNGLDNQLTGWNGANLLNGKAGNDTLAGGLGNDTLKGGLGDDRMDGGQGDDRYLVDSAGDVLFEFADEGTDTVSASLSWTLGDDVEFLLLTGTGHLSGGGNDIDNGITGNTGDNSLTGRAGADTLTGGDGNDTLSGGTGSDYLVGGAGDDVYLFSAAPDAAGNLDTISGLGATDSVRLSGAAFAGVPVGSLAAGRFVLGSAALDTSDRIVYDQAGGILYYDADGTGEIAQVAFAVVEGREALTAGQFVVA